MAPPLTAEQVRQFRTEGFLVLRDFLEPAVLEGWRAQFWAHQGEAYGVVEHDPKTWGKVGHAEEDIFFQLQPEFGQLPQVVQAVAQLGGAGFLPKTRPSDPGQTQTVATMPGDYGPRVARPGTTQRQIAGSHPPHIDGFANHRGPGLGLMIGATTYLYDVEAGGGCLCLWPRSHIPVHRYFVAHVEEAQKSAATVSKKLLSKLFGDEFAGEFGGDRGEFEEKRASAGGVEFTGKAGDCVLWHSQLIHSGSPNFSSVPRVGLFTRWHHAGLERARFASEMWEAWEVPEALRTAARL